MWSFEAIEFVFQTIVGILFWSVLVKDKVFLCGVCYIHQELEDIEVRLRHGGLGGVPVFERWTKKLAAAATVQDFVSILKLIEI